MDFRPEDMEIKRKEDAFRQAYVDGTVTGDSAFTEVPLPFGMQHEMSPYPLSNHVYGGRKNKVEVGAFVTEKDMATVLAKLPQPFLSDLSLLEGAVIAGGDALRMASCSAPPDHKQTDVDIFFIGRGDVLQKTDRMMRAIAQLYTTRDGMPRYAMSRTANGITATCHAMYAFSTERTKDRKVLQPPAIFQFIMREYDDLPQVLSGFDLDASAIALGVKDGLPYISALPRALRALRWQANLVDTDRQSETFEQRIHKYAVNKGFDAIVAGVDIPSVTFQRLSAHDGKNGLYALLRMTLHSRNTARNDATYAGAVNGLDLRGDERTFSYRFASRAYNSSFPMVFAVQHSSSQQRYANNAKKAKKADAANAAMISLLPILQELIDTTRAAHDKTHVPFEILAGHCNSFRPLSNDWLA